MSIHVRLLGGLCPLGLLLVMVTAAPPQPTRKATTHAALEKPWTQTEREEFYHLPEGSELFPADLLAALVSARTGKPFLEGLGRFGAIDDPDGPVVKGTSGDYKLPVGLTLAKSRADGLAMIGVTCALCHVNEVRYGKAKVRIDGGSSLFDVESFFQEAFVSVAATFRDRAALLSFLDRLAKSPSKTKVSALAAKLHAALRIEGGKDGLAEAIAGRLHDLAQDGAGGAAPDYFRLLAPRDPAEADEKAIDLLEVLAKRLEGRTGDRSRVRNLFSSKRAAAEEDLRKTLEDLGPAGLARLEARVVFLRRLRQQHAPEKPQYPPGFGRVDAFGTARNLLFSDKDALPASAPVRFPAIWDLQKRKWLHWDANTNSVLERNIGQALGLGGLATADGHSTVLPRNLHALELLARKLKAPAWPAEFPKIDADKRDAGKKLYGTHCAACHDRGEGEYQGEKKEFAGFRVYSLDQIGTDPERAENFAKPLSDKTPFPKALAVKLRAIKKQAYVDHKITAEEQKEYDLPDDEIRIVAPRAYVARPLAGVWATAPYLHNGSVPTLDDLLLPEEDRPVVFPVGPPEYDPVKVGVVSAFASVPKDQRGRMSIYDTRLKGNSNRGHSGKAFGTHLDAKQRAQLLEYLKSLGG